MTKICARCILDKVKIINLSWLEIKKINCGHGCQKGHPLHGSSFTILAIGYMMAIDILFPRMYGIVVGHALVHVTYLFFFPFHDDLGGFTHPLLCIFM